MTQQEFEFLYGKKVQVLEFEVINEMYMLDENETKKQFVERFKKMNAAVMLANFAEVLSKLRERHSEELADRSTRDTQALNELREHEKELEGANEYLGNQLAEANQKLHDFASMVAVETHQFDKTATVSACVETLGLVGYYKKLLNAGCIPTQDDLKLAIEALEK